MPSLLATARAVCSLSPVSITMPQAQVVQRADRLGRRRLDRIGDGERAGELAVDGDEHHGVACRAAQAHAR